MTQTNDSYNTGCTY